MIKKWSFESQETFDNDFFDCLVSVLVWEEGPQVALHAHAVISSNHSHLASWTKLGLQLVVTDSTHGMAAVALHDPRLMCHVLKANGAFWVDELHLLIETRLLTEFSRLASLCSTLIKFFDMLLLTLSSWNCFHSFLTVKVISKLWLNFLDHRFEIYSCMNSFKFSSL